MSSNSVLASSPSSTLAMLQAMARSWQSESQDQISQDIASLKANGSSGARSTIFVGMTSGSKFTSTLFNTGSSANQTQDEQSNSQSMQDWISKEASKFNSQHSMSSSDISNLMYSGGGLEEPGDSGKLDTFSSIIQDMLSGNTPDIKLASQLSQAFSSHTLTIQKSSDVAGLDYQQSSGLAGTASGNVSFNDESWNTKLVNTTVDENGNYVANKGSDGKTHFVMEVGDAVSLYLTW